MKKKSFGHDVGAMLANAQSCLQQGDYGQAMRACEHVLKIERTNSDAWHLLGLAHHEKGDFVAARHSVAKAVKLDPNFAPYHNSMGVVLRSMGRDAEAATSYLRAIKLYPDYCDARVNLGNVLCADFKWAEAELHFRSAVEVNAKSLKALNGLGLALSMQGDFCQAKEYLQTALSIRATYLPAINNLRRLAGKCCDRAERIRLTELVIHCSPDNIEAYADLAMMYSYDDECNNYELFEKHLQAAMSISGKYPQLNLKTTELRSDRRLRIGYVSPDLCGNHPVVSFMRGVLACHDYELMDIYCYSTGKKNEGVNSGLHSLVANWFDVSSLTYDGLAEKIRQDCVDILVDLAGHTLGNSLPVFAMKPAPVQVAWLGYPNTTGLKTIDFRLTDVVADPVGGSDRFYTENLWRLPGGFLCYVPPESTPPVGSLPVFQNGYITFGSFNNIDKLSVNTVCLWCELLNRVEAAKLLLKGPQLEHRDTQKFLMQQFVKCGVSEDRVVLKAPTKEVEAHLEMYNEMDIALDPFPYNGTTTTCEALLMGVPVLTLVGNRHAARVGASILTAVGIEEFIANSEEEFIDKGCSLAGNINRLAGLKITLREKLLNSSLCDAKEFTRQLEKAYQKMWGAFAKVKG